MKKNTPARLIAPRDGTCDILDVFGKKLQVTRLICHPTRGQTSNKLVLVCHGTPGHCVMDIRGGGDECLSTCHLMSNYFIQTQSFMKSLAAGCSQNFIGVQLVSYFTVKCPNIRCEYLKYFL